MYFIKICDMKIYSLLIAAAWLLNACDGAETEPDAGIKEQARKFAEAYFNYDFATASHLATPESEKWLRFAASNVTQEDIDVINGTPEAATAEVTKCCHLDDSTARVVVTVSGVVLKDSIGQPAHVASEAEFALTLVRRNDDYIVRMEGLPRNEKHSRGSVSGE